MIDIEGIRARFSDLSAHLDERGRRLLAASEARAAGYGGGPAAGRGGGQGAARAGVSRATGLAASRSGRGLRDRLDRLPPGRVRKLGGGGKTAEERDPGLLPELLALVEPGARGD